jgi:hypothetical protein
MKPVLRGVLVAVVQVALMAAVGGVLLYERATLPRAWVETGGVDPDLPIRGRYVALNLVLPEAPGSSAVTTEFVWGRIEVRDGRAVAGFEGDEPRPSPFEAPLVYFGRQADAGKWRVLQPVALFFLPEHAPDPTREVKPGELWAEVTVPPRGAPRPIRLGLMRDGTIEPLR